MSRPHPETISPTAHYTGYVWYVSGQSHEAFATRRGRWMYEALRAPNSVAHRVGLPTIPGMLLARHRLIDLRLQNAIDAGEISQIVEVAAGLSPRGWRFRTRYGDAITYVEADLPGMLANKRRVLAQLGGETKTHYTVEIDALVDRGPTSIDHICAQLDPTRGTAIITEGLINYFAEDLLMGMWRRFAATLRVFPRNLYLSDIILKSDAEDTFARVYSWILTAFVRGKVHPHFTSVVEAEAALESAGLLGVLLDPRDFSYELPDIERAGAGRVRIIESIAKV
jgi:O-methyltransferase involved in polyketide biosynthesis